MIKETSIDDVRNADIVRVIGNKLGDLTKAGTVYQCKSPFTTEKTGSFTVFPKTNTFKCFSSGAGGDAIKFIQMIDRVSFYDAVKTIASICDIILVEEEVSEEVKAKVEYKQQLFDLTNSAANRYAGELLKLDENHWVKKMISEREINTDTIAAFGIGYAPNNAQFITNPIIEKGKLELAVTVGLTNTKEGRSYDFFRDKLIFPIHDFKGNIVGFGGRRSNESEGPKYINSKDSEVYKKQSVLYGLYQGKSEIAKRNKAILVEGYTDVTALHQHGVEIAVANCGTASMSPVQCGLLNRLANHIVICRDNDGSDLSESGSFQKGIGAMMKDINVLLAANFKVSVLVLPEGEDPDSFSRKTENAKDYFLNEDNYEDAVLWKTLKLKNRAANDPNLIDELVHDVAEMLFQIKSDAKRNSYLTTCTKLIKQPVKVLKDAMQQFVTIAEKKNETTTAVKQQDAETLGLPEGADYRQYFEKGFVNHECNVYFKGRERFIKGTNFKITPLFHVYGKQDNKRLCEVISEYGKKKIIDFDTSDFVQMAKFESKLLDEGNFTFTADVTANQFKLLRNDILNSFIMAYELKTLGWQQEKFFAFANCVYHDGLIKDANDYGIIQLETGVQTESEYMEDVKHFYSPSASVMYKFTRDGDDPYENDRYFIYKKSPITMDEWMQQLKKVYGKKAVTGIAFIFATLFRDIYLKRYQFFPHLFCTGEKGSGKSKYGESLVALFTYKQEPFDLNSGTPVAFYRRLSRIMNAPTMLEEYHDSVDDKIFQPLKGAYDGRGREMGKATGDNRTTTTKVNCSLIILSQYLSARDDNSLTSRSIVEHFIKPMESYTTAEIEDYAKLKSWEEAGMSSMLCDILEHRGKVEENIHIEFAAASKKMKAELKGKEYQERMLQNYLALYVPIKILKPHFHFPFTEAEIWNQFKEAILDSSDLIIESEGLAEFWRVLEFLLDTHRIKNTKEFKIDKPLDFKLQGRKGEAEVTWTNTHKNNILFLRLSAVHQLYHKEVSTREGVDVISENTLKNYFKSKKYFIGSVKSMRFDDTSTSAYAFNYDLLINGGILNLSRSADDFLKQPTPGEPTPDEDLPF